MQNPVALILLTFFATGFIFLLAVGFWLALKTVREAAQGVTALAGLVKGAAASLEEFSGELTELRDSTLRALESKSLLESMRCFPRLADTGAKLSVDVDELRKLLAKTYGLLVHNATVAQQQVDKGQSESALYTWSEEAAARNEALRMANLKEEPPAQEPDGVGSEV